MSNIFRSKLSQAVTAPVLGLTAKMSSRMQHALVLTAVGLGAASSGFIFYKAMCRLSQGGAPLPPGPNGWPLVGCIGLLTPDLYLKLTDLGKHYGDIFSFYIGNRLTVVLNSATAVREAFLKHGVTFAGRPHPWVMEIVDVKEMINNGTYSDEWKAERKFVLNALRQFGYGSASMEVKMAEEINRLLDIYKHSASNDIALNPRKHMPKAMANLIFSILINERYDYEDRQLTEKLQLISRWQKRVGEANMIDFFPWLRYLPWGAIKRLKQIRSELVPVYRKHILDHKDTFDSTCSRDVIDVYLKARGIHYDGNKLIGLFFSFVGDAVDSLPEAMVWMVLYICSDLDIQRKIQHEIDTVTGDSNEVTLADRARMPLTQATVMEALRLSTFVPLSEPHCPLQATTLFGYHIPRGCNVLANLYAIHMDEKSWVNPQKFNPERFIGADRKLHVCNAFMPYSIGQRMCLGRELSNKIMFFFLARLLMNFNLTYSDLNNPPPLQPQKWFVRKAQDFSIKVVSRK